MGFGLPCKVVTNETTFFDFCEIHLKKHCLIFSVHFGAVVYAVANLCVRLKVDVLRIGNGFVDCLPIN